MAERIDPEMTREHVASADALLVCAYDAPEKWRDNYVDGAITMHELRARERQLPRSQEIIFYCA